MHSRQTMKAIQKLSKKKVKEAIKEAGSQRKAAKLLGVSTHYLRKVLGTAHVDGSYVKRHVGEFPTRDEVLEAIKQYGTREKARTVLGITKHRFYEILNQVHEPVEVPPGEKPGRSAHEFRNLFDKDHIVPQRIKKALKAMGSNWFYESEFARFAGITLSALATYRDMFSPHIVEIRKTSRRVWFGSPTVADEMRAKV